MTGEAKETLTATDGVTEGNLTATEEKLSATSATKGKLNATGATEAQVTAT